MAVTEKTKIGTIDLRPTWVGILPSLLILVEDGNSTGRATAINELQRMARLADAYVATAPSQS